MPNVFPRRIDTFSLSINAFLELVWSDYQGLKGPNLDVEGGFELSLFQYRKEVAQHRRDNQACPKAPTNWRITQLQCFMC